MSDIDIIAFDGGPCAGKSTGLAKLQQALRERGVKVVVVPEAATRIQTAGLTPTDEWRGSMDFQRLVLQDQVQQEDFYKEGLNRLQANNRKVMLCDRATITGQAYTQTPEAFEQLVQQMGYSMQELSRRYDGIVHMRTAAYGAEEYYTHENNPARDEKPKEAQRLDDKILQAWTGHSTLQVIENVVDGEQISFEKKVARAKQAVMQMLGIPDPIELERKFRIESPRDLKRKLKEAGVPFTTVYIRQYYLHPDGFDERRVRERIIGESPAYYYTEKEETGILEERIEREEIISRAEYEDRLEERDLAYSPIHKERVCFIYNGHYFKLDQFQGELAGTHLLEVEPLQENTKISNPPFISVIEEVTDHEVWGRNRALALHGTPS